MTEETSSKKMIKKAQVLLEKRKRILQLPSEEALDMILGSALPAELIQSFSEEDLYFLVHEIGHGDVLPVMALASSDQWGHMLDVEVWDRDRLDIDSVTRWLRLLLLADSERTVRWLLTERLEFTELYLFRNIEVIIREENQDPSEFPDGFFTYDDYFYVRIIELEETIPDSDDDMIRQEDREEVIRVFIEQLVALDHGMYQRVMLESMSVVPAEIEEEDYRIRNVRLAEKGFQPFDDALKIYSPLTTDEVHTLNEEKVQRSSEDDEIMPAPISHFSEVKGDSLFTGALELIDRDQELQQLQVEFATLCNLIVSADKKQVRERKELGSVVAKACGYVSIGLETLSGEGRTSAADLVGLLRSFRLETLFRAGYGQVSDLKKRAEKFRNEGWFKSRKLPLNFWGEEWLGVLGGLLVPRPLCFDNYKTGVLYRDFSSREDIVATEKVLDDIKGFDDLLSILSPDTECFTGYFLTCYNLLLTQWVNQCCGRDKDSGPVPIAMFRNYYDTIWDPDISRDGTTPGKIRTEEKENLLSWLSMQTGLTEFEISDQLGMGLEAMFVDFENNYGTVSSANLDYRYVHHVCIESDVLPDSE